MQQERTVPAVDERCRFGEREVPHTHSEHLARAPRPGCCPPAGLIQHRRRGINADHALPRRPCDGDGDPSVPDCQLDQRTVCLKGQ